MFSFLTPELLIGLTGLVTAVVKVFGDRKAKRKTDWEALGRSAWLMFIGTLGSTPLPTRSETVKQWRQTAERLAEGWGVKIPPKVWSKLQAQALNRWELESRRQWDSGMAALLEAASGADRWMNGLAPEVLRMPKRADTVPPSDIGEH